MTATGNHDEFSRAIHSSRMHRARRRVDRDARARRSTTSPLNTIPCAGTPTTPSIARCPSINAMFTVNSPLRLTNSFVPSSGSTSQYAVPRPACCKVRQIRFFRQHRNVRRQRDRARRGSARCDARSACVRGDESSLVDHVEVRLVDLHDLATGVIDDGDERVDELLAVLECRACDLSWAGRDVGVGSKRVSIRTCL